MANIYIEEYWESITCSKHQYKEFKLRPDEVFGVLSYVLDAANSLCSSVVKLLSNKYRNEIRTNSVDIYNNILL